MGAVFYKAGPKNAGKLAPSRLKTKVQQLLTVLQSDPWQTQPRFKNLMGDLSGASLRRINFQHRLVYQILEAENSVNILQRWTDYS